MAPRSIFYMRIFERWYFGLCWNLRFWFFSDFHLLKVKFLVLILFWKKKNGFFIAGWGCLVFRSMIFRVLLKFDSYIVIMDRMCVERVILIWMLLSLTLGNFLFCISQARDLLFQNLSPSMFGVQPILWTWL